MDRLIYGAIGAAFGAVLGIVCWWLYGLAFSLQYPGPGIDPTIKHWVIAGGGVFAGLGLIFKDRVGSLAGDLLAGILRFEAGHTPEHHLTGWQIVAVLGILLLVLWYVAT